MHSSIASALIVLILQVGAPTGLKITGDANGVRLSWTAAPGTGNSYRIERGGPGYTLYTQIGGPIAETSFVVDTRGYDRCKVQTENYSYRVRTIDAATNTSVTSNVVWTRDIAGPVCNLPLVGNNILDLIAALANSTKFYMTGVKERTVSFVSADLRQSFSWGCVDCSFVVGVDGINSATSSSRGIVFKLNADGSEILATCRAVQCQAFTDSKGISWAAGESITLSTQPRTFFTATLR